MSVDPPALRPPPVPGASPDPGAEAATRKGSAALGAIVVLAVALVLGGLAGQLSVAYDYGSLVQGVLLGVLIGGVTFLVGVTIVRVVDRPRRAMAAAIAALVPVVVHLVGPWQEGQYLAQIVSAVLAAVGAGVVWASVPRASRPQSVDPGTFTTAYAADGTVVLVPVHRSTNGFAIAALVFGLIGGWVFAIIFGAVALSQVKKTGGHQSGRGLAIAGIVLGCVWLVAYAALVAVLNGAA